MDCIRVFNEKETMKIGKKLACLSCPGDIICLIGDLGTGKTTFTKAIASGLGVEDDVTSPTFTILQEYEGRIPVYHFDVYRIEDIREMEDIPYEEYFYGKGICVIEWAEIIRELLPENYMEIHIKYLGEGKRELCFTARGNYYKEKLEELLS